MRKIKIKQPIWKDRSVGIASYIYDDIEIEILAKNKDGVKHFPNKFLVHKQDLIRYPVQTFSKGVPVRIVPIKELSVIQK